MNDATTAPVPAASNKAPAPVVATVVDAGGVRRLATAGELRGLIATGKLCWIDIAGSDAGVRAGFLAETGLGAADLAWAQRFGQTGRLGVGR